MPGRGPPPTTRTSSTDRTPIGAGSPTSSDTGGSAPSLAAKKAAEAGVPYDAARAVAQRELVKPYRPVGRFDRNRDVVSVGALEAARLGKTLAELLAAKVALDAEHQGSARR